MKTLVLVVIATLALSITAVASPIPGSINELVNGNFETGLTAPWEVGADLLLSNHPDDHGWTISCKRSGGDLLLRQVADETLNPLWDWNDHAKFIDLQADIRVTAQYLPPTSGVRFRLDWWDERYNQFDTQPTDQVSGVSDWQTIYFADIPNYQAGTWITVNPFNNDGIIFKDFQPRWVSVEVELIQGLDEIVWVDNLNLTSKCVPEPMSVMLGVLGLGAIGTFRRTRRK